MPSDKMRFLPQPPERLGLYIHWPFCLSKCPYCDFNSHVWETIPHTDMEKAFLTELSSMAHLIGKRPLTSIFFGGGTPSLMRPQTVQALIDRACHLFSPVEDIEITLEANPTSIETAKLENFYQAGINRLSIGVQSFDEAALSALGRKHSALQAQTAIETARNIFPRYSFDLIYARPDQKIEAWKKELTTSLSLAGDHLSLYQLTIEPNTVYDSLHRQGRLTLPEDGQSAQFYMETNAVMQQFGFSSYEVSNYAQPSGESRHNLIYWQYQDYIGIGPGAHGRLTHDGHIWSTRTHRAPSAWLEQVVKRGTGMRQHIPLTSQEIAHEMILMGLRLEKGIQQEAVFNRTGQLLSDILDQTILSACLEENYLQWNNNSLAATPSGRLRLEAILAALL